jgi:hypothetical protein
MKNFGLFVTFYMNLDTRSRSQHKKLRIRLQLHQQKVAAPPAPAPQHCFTEKSKKVDFFVFRFNVVQCRRWGRLAQYVRPLDEASPSIKSENKPSASNPAPEASRVPDISSVAGVESPVRGESLDMSSLNLTDDVIRSTDASGHVGNVVTSECDNAPCRVTEAAVASAIPLPEEETPNSSEGTTAMQSREEVGKYKRNFLMDADLLIRMHWCTQRSVS